MLKVFLSNMSFKFNSHILEKFLHLNQKFKMEEERNKLTKGKTGCD